MFLAVVGLVALIRTGFGDLTSPEATVLGFTFTPLMALIQSVVGLFWLGASASPREAQSFLSQLGVLAVVFGLVVIIEPTGLRDSLGADARMGWLYLVVGTFSALAGWLAPVRHVRTAERKD